jgi:hypothetical protein
MNDQQQFLFDFVSGAVKAFLFMVALLVVVSLWGAF